MGNWNWKLARVRLRIVNWLRRDWDRLRIQVRDQDQLGGKEMPVE